MNLPRFDTTRRAVLATALGLLTTGSGAQTPTPTTLAAAPRGKPGEFDFLSGSWRIRHRRRKADGQWDEFDGEATCWSILAGTGSIEELRIPARDFSGMGIRLLDPKTLVWADYWVNGKERVIGEPGLTGGFTAGVGTFTAADTHDGKPMIVRGVWDRITPRSHRWRQGMSHDIGATWDDSWFMDWTRV